MNIKKLSYSTDENGKRCADRDAGAFTDRHGGFSVDVTITRAGREVKRLVIPTEQLIDEDALRRCIKSGATSTDDVLEMRPRR